MIVTKAWADLPRLFAYTYVTGLETILGYMVAIVIALPLGLAIAFSSILRRTIYPFFVTIEMVPKIAFAPIFISWLGFGLLPKVIIVFLVCFFPIVLNAILAFNSLSEELQRFSRSTGAGVWTGAGTGAATLEKLRAMATGDFADQVDTLSSTVAGVLKQGEVASSGTITSVGVEKLEGSRATVLIAATSLVTNSELPQGELRTFRMAVGLVRTGAASGGWKVDDVEFLG